MVANFDKNFVIPKQSAAQLPVGKHERKRQILHIVAVRSALVGFVLIMSLFVASGLAAVPGAHVDDVDSLPWMVAGCLIMISPIGLICVGFAGILLIIRASLH